MALMFFSRTVLVLFSIISGVWLITPIQLLFMGVVCDLFAMVMIAFEKPEKAILKSKAGSQCDQKIDRIIGICRQKIHKPTIQKKYLNWNNILRF